MKLNLSGWYLGRIGLEKLVIDLSRAQVRRRATEADLEKYYAECIKKASQHPEYFANQEAFQRTIDDVLAAKKAKLVAKGPNYVPLWNIKAQKGEIDQFLNNLGNDSSTSKYFYGARIHISWPLGEGSVFAQLVDKGDPNISVTKVEQWATMEVPNDRTLAETKTSTIHETLHWLITYYQILSGRLMISRAKMDELGTKKDQRRAHYFAQEGAIEYLTEVLLEDDKETLLEHRWSRYNRRAAWKKVAEFAVPIATGSLLGLSITNPVLTPLIFAPAAISRICYALYRHAKREELTMPIERVQFKI